MPDSTLSLLTTTPLHAADGYPVDTMNQHEVNELQRGPLGSTTVLTIAPKDPSQEVKTVYLERRPLPQPPLKQVSNSALVLRTLPSACSTDAQHCTWPVNVPCMQHCTCLMSAHA